MFFVTGGAGARLRVPVPDLTPASIRQRRGGPILPVEVLLHPGGAAIGRLEDRFGPADRPAGRRVDEKDVVKIDRNLRGSGASLPNKMILPLPAAGRLRFLSLAAIGRMYNFLFQACCPPFD